MLQLRFGFALGFALLLATAPAYALSTTYQLEPTPAQLIGLGAIALGMMRRRKVR